MVKGLERIPQEVRWQLATNGLTSAIVAYSDALKDAIGEKKYHEFEKRLWGESVKETREFADKFGMPSVTSRDINEVLETLALATMGPEFDFSVVESSDERCVGRTTKCPWHERAKELGVKWDHCTTGHTSWGKGCVDALNSDYTFRLTKNMQRGDPCCEWIIEKKK